MPGVVRWTEPIHHYDQGPMELQRAGCGMPEADRAALEYLVALALSDGRA